MEPVLGPEACRVSGMRPNQLLARWSLLAEPSGAIKQARRKLAFRA